MSAHRRAPRATQSSSPVWGKHLLIDAYGIDRSALQNIRALRRLLRELPAWLRMRILAKPVTAKVSSPDYPDWGVSGFVMLYESHISFHTWPEEGYVAMDIYSCKDFDETAAVAYLKEFFGGGKIRKRVVIRR